MNLTEALLCAFVLSGSSALACTGYGEDASLTSGCQEVGPSVMFCDPVQSWNALPTTTGVSFKTLTPNGTFSVVEYPLGVSLNDQNAIVYARQIANSYGQFYPETYEVVDETFETLNGCVLASIEFDNQLPFQVTPSDVIPQPWHTLVMVFGLEATAVVVVLESKNAVWRPETVPFRQLERDIRARLLFGSTG